MPDYQHCDSYERLRRQGRAFLTLMKEWLTMRRVVSVSHPRSPPRSVPNCLSCSGITHRRRAMMAVLYLVLSHFSHLWKRGFCSFLLLFLLIPGENINHFLTFLLPPWG